MRINILNNEDIYIYIYIYDFLYYNNIISFIYIYLNKWAC